MKYGIGIDSGGTFTDGVIMELGSGEIIAQAKVPTTHHNLIRGIRNCLTELRQGKACNISRVCLSTTLATNAVVEGKGWDVGVLLVGHEPKGDIPSTHVYTLQGGHDAAGAPLQELDIQGGEELVASLKGRVEAFAVSSLMSVRNPEHELWLKRIIREMTGCPVVCGHELTSVLGVHERTVTAVLNARLLPVIQQLIEDVQETLVEQGIKAPLLLVKGDGTLFPAENALEYPIETLLSGPAASVAGARFLSGKEEALIADMGGTTTDIAIIVGGTPKVSEEGAAVGGWLTRVRAVDVTTVGLGGDSYIQMGKDGKIALGPRRVVPVSVAAKEFPEMVCQLNELTQTDHTSVMHQPLDFFSAGKLAGTSPLSPEHQRIMGGIPATPRTVSSIARQLDTDPDLLHLRELENKGIIRRVSLTPTDLLVARGLCSLGDQEAARLAVEAVTRAWDLTVESLYIRVNEEINLMLTKSLLKKVLPAQGTGCHICPLIVESIISPSKNNFSLSFELTVPLVAVGAPATVYFPPVVENLCRELILPPHAAVANAVGAIASQVVEEVEILIRPLAVCGYRIFAPWGKLDLNDQSIAVVKEKVANMAKTHIVERLRFCEEEDIIFFIDTQDIISDAAKRSEKEFYIETRIKVKGIADY